MPEELLPSRRLTGCFASPFPKQKDVFILRSARVCSCKSASIDAPIDAPVSVHSVPGAMLSDANALRSKICFIKSDAKCKTLYSVPAC